MPGDMRALGGAERRPNLCLMQEKGSVPAIVVQEKGSVPAIVVQEKGSVPAIVDEKGSVPAIVESRIDEGGGC